MNQPYWPVLIVRALPALVIATVITFSADHSVILGLVLFGIFAASTGIIVAVGGVRTAHPRLVTTLSLIHGVVGVVAGVVSILLVLLASSVSIGMLIFILSAHAAVTGFVELYAGLSTRGVFAASRDWVFLGGITALFALALLFIPLELRDPVKGQHGIEGYLTAPVVAVGLLGAYCAIIAVYLVIAGLSLKWAPTSSAANAAERVE